MGPVGSAQLGAIATNSLTAGAPLIKLVRNGNGHRACELGQRGWHQSIMPINWKTGHYCPVFLCVTALYQPQCSNATRFKSGATASSLIAAIASARVMTTLS